MAIYDCFQYFNEDHMVDLRINIMNEYVDYFGLRTTVKQQKNFLRMIIQNFGGLNQMVVDKLQKIL